MYTSVLDNLETGEYMKIILVMRSITENETPGIFLDSSIRSLRDFIKKHAA
jgi:hypothetical protein